MQKREGTARTATYKPSRRIQQNADKLSPGPTTRPPKSTLWKAAQRSTWSSPSVAAHLSELALETRHATHKAAQPREWISANARTPQQAGYTMRDLPSRLNDGMHEFQTDCYGHADTRT